VQSDDTGLIESANKRRQLGAVEVGPPNLAAIYVDPYIWPPARSRASPPGPACPLTRIVWPVPSRLARRISPPSKAAQYIRPLARSRWIRVGEGRPVKRICCSVPSSLARRILPLPNGSVQYIKSDRAWPITPKNRFRTTMPQKNRFRDEALPPD